MGDVILGKVIIRGKIRLKTGLHIGAQRETMEIGGIDNPVIKDPITGQPYIPGSSLKGKLRVAMEYFIAPKKDDSDETLQSFGYRRVGQEMTDVFLDAMVAGIYASTPDKISVNAAFPAVVKLEKEYGGLFRGMLAKRKKDAGPGGVLLSFKGGVSSFIQRLSKVYDIDILKDITIDKIEKEGTKFRVLGENVDMRFDKIVLSTEAFESARILGDFNQTRAVKFLHNCSSCFVFNCCCLSWFELF